MKSLVESILDDEDVAVGAMDDILLSKDLTNRLNEPAYEYLRYTERSIVDARIYSSKKIIDVYMTDKTKRETTLDLWDIDLRYEIFMEYLNQGYTINFYGRRSIDYQQEGHRRDANQLIGLYLNEYWFDGHDYESQLANFSKIISNSSFIIKQPAGRDIDKRNLNYLLKETSGGVTDFKNLPNCNTLIIPATFGASYVYQILNLNCKRLFIEGRLVVKDRQLFLYKCNIDRLVYSNISKSFSIYDWQVIKFDKNNIKHLLIDLAYEFNLQHVFASNFEELKYLTEPKFKSYDDALHKYSPLRRMNNWMREKAKQRQLKFSDFEAISPDISLKLESQIYSLNKVKNKLTGLEYPKWERD